MRKKYNNRYSSVWKRSKLSAKRLRFDKLKRSIPKKVISKELKNLIKKLVEFSIIEGKKIVGIVKNASNINLL